MTGFPSSASFKPTEVQSGIRLAPLAKWLSALTSSDELNKLNELLERFRTPQSYHRVDFRVIDSSELPPSPREAYTAIPDNWDTPIEVDASPSPVDASPPPADTKASEEGDGAAGTTNGGVAEEDEVDFAIQKAPTPGEGGEVTGPDATEESGSTGPRDTALDDDLALKPRRDEVNGETAVPATEATQTAPAPSFDSVSRNSQPPPQSPAILPQPVSAAIAGDDSISPETRTAATSPAQVDVSVVDHSTPSKDNAGAEVEPAGGKSEAESQPSPSTSQPRQSTQPPSDLTDSNITLAIIALGAAGVVPGSISQEDEEEDPSSRQGSPALPDYPPPPGPTNRCVRELRVDLRTLDPAALFNLESWRRRALGLSPLAMAVPDSVWYKVLSDSPPPKRGRGRLSKPLKATASASAEPSRGSLSGDDDVTLLGNSVPGPAGGDTGLDKATVNKAEDVVEIDDRSPSPDIILPDGDRSDDPDFKPSPERIRRTKLPRVRSPEVDLPEGLETEEEELNNALGNQPSSSMQPDELSTGIVEEVNAGELEDQPISIASDESEGGQLNSPSRMDEASPERPLPAGDTASPEAAAPSDVEMELDLVDDDGDEPLPLEDVHDDEEGLNNDLPDEESDEEAAFNNLQVEEVEEDEEDAQEPQPDDGDIDLPKSGHDAIVLDPPSDTEGQPPAASHDDRSETSDGRHISASKSPAKARSTATPVSQRGRVTLARRYRTSAPLSSSSSHPAPVSVHESDPESSTAVTGNRRSPRNSSRLRSPATPDERSPEPEPALRPTRAVRSTKPVTPEPVASPKSARSPTPAPVEPPSRRRTRTAAAAEASSPPASAPRSTRSIRAYFVSTKPASSQKQAPSSSPAQPAKPTSTSPHSTAHRTRATAAIEEQTEASTSTPRRRVDVGPSPRRPSPPSVSLRTRTSALHIQPVEQPSLETSRRRRARSPTTDEGAASDVEPETQPPPSKRVRVTQMARRSKPLPAAPSTQATRARTQTPPPRMILDCVEVTRLSAAARAKYTRLPEPAPLAAVFVQKTRLNPAEVFVPARYPQLQVQRPRTPIIRNAPPPTTLYSKHEPATRGHDKSGARRARPKRADADDDEDEWSAFKF